MDIGTQLYGNTVNLNQNEISILFIDGTILKKLSNIDVDVNDSGHGFTYTSTVLLTQSDLATLSTKQIKKFRLYIYDQDIMDDKSKIFMSDVKCIIKTN